DSNGAGGYHLWVLLSSPVPTPLVFAFLRRLTADYAQYDLTARPEHFPKKPYIESDKYGNWLRTPRMHHTRQHLSQLWDGGRWLSGAPAVDFLLSFAGDSPTLVPAAPPPSPRPTRTVSSSKQQRYTARGSLSEKIAAYMRRLP